MRGGKQMRILFAALLGVSSGAPAAGAGAAPSPSLPQVPPAVTLPSQLTLQEALQMLRARGLDLLIAQAQVSSAEGDVQSAGALYNPNVAFSAGPVFNYSANPPGSSCRGCQAYALNWSLFDNGALLDVLVGKRGLRLRAARAALFAARLSRADAQRTLEGQLKQLYMQVGLTRMALLFAQEIQAAMAQTLELNKLRYPKVIDEGTLSRIELQKLEADQGVTAAVSALRQAQVSVAFLLGVRDEVPDFTVEQELFKFQVPTGLSEATEESLLSRALQLRPDLQAAAAQREQAQFALTLARRLQFPDISLQALYTQIGVGQDAGQPPVLALGVALNLPIFYQQQGEIRRAQANLDTQSLQQYKTVAQIASDIGAAMAAYRATREQVERMEGVMLARAKRARDIVEIQYKAGAATLIDFLDAQRTYIATNQEYFQDLANYWTAVYQVEQAVGAELRR